MTSSSDSTKTASVIVDAQILDRPTGRPRILLTNDDGIESPGLLLLAERLAKKHETVVVAPDTNRSGSGTGIGSFDPDKGVRLMPVRIPGVEAYQIDGPPGLAVMASALGAFGRRPDLVVSGVNAGMNTGHSVIHSGTVGGALTARTFGTRGAAVSLAASDPWHWDTAVAVAERVVDWLLERPRGAYVLNVNVPALPFQRLRGVTWAKLDEFGYFRVASTDESKSRLSFGIAARDSGLDPACDTARCLDGFVTLTPLATVEHQSVEWVAANEVCRLS
jgi:5'-nucleotidase